MSIKPHQTLLTSKEADVLEKSTVQKSESEETKNMMLSFKISAGLSFTLFYFCSWNCSITMARIILIFAPSLLQHLPTIYKSDIPTPWNSLFNVLSSKHLYQQKCSSTISIHAPTSLILHLLSLISSFPFLTWLNSTVKCSEQYFFPYSAFVQHQAQCSLLNYHIKLIDNTKNEDCRAYPILHITGEKKSSKSSTANIFMLTNICMLALPPLKSVGSTC